LLLEFVNLTEEQSPGWAVVDAGGLEPLVDPLHAEVTVLYAIGDGVELRYPEGAGFNTNEAADAFLYVKQNNSVWALGYCIHRTGFLAGWFPAMHAMDWIEVHSQSA